MTEKVCSKCGRCCSVLPLLIANMSPEYLAYLRERGLQEDQGFILVPHDCRHLSRTGHIDGIATKEGNLITDVKVESVTLDPEYSCDIHDHPDRPRLCKIYHGQRRGSKHILFYIPPGCTMRNDGT
jgi:hypothetical protein